MRGPASSVAFCPSQVPSQLQHPGQAPAHCALRTHQQLLTGKDDHVHAPEDAHDPAHHNDGREHLNEGCSNIQPEDAAHVPVREVSACPTQHSEGRDECTWERPEGIASEEAAGPTQPTLHSWERSYRSCTSWAALLLGSQLQLVTKVKRLSHGRGVTWELPGSSTMPMASGE